MGLFRRKVTATVAVVIATAGLTGLSVGVKPDRAIATPGSPGVPGPGILLFEEDFENSPNATITPLASYASATGQAYTADPAWLDTNDCNGFVLSASVPLANYGSCLGTFWYHPIGRLRELADAVGQFNGQPAGENSLVSAYTFKINRASGLVEFQTAAAVPLSPVPGGRFVSFSVDIGAQNCDAAIYSPLLQFALSSGGSETPMGDPIDGCGGLTGFVTNVDRLVTNEGVYFAGSSLDVVMRNLEGRQNGNDHAFDNIRVIDTTPQIDKSFSRPTTAVGSSVRATFTITNTDELGAKAGWEFTDTLPSGMTIADPADFSTTCENGAFTGTAGGSQAAFSGDLTTGQASCTLSISVTSSTAGSYTNGPGDISDVRGLLLPADATVEFVAPEATADTSTTPQDVPVTVPVLTNDTFPPGSTADPASVQLRDPATGSYGTTVTIPGEGTYTVNPATGEVAFDPVPSFVGNATPITYRVADDLGNTATATIGIEVTQIVPTAQDDSASTAVDTNVTIPVVANDQPGDPSAPLDPTSVRLRNPATGAFGTTVTIPGEGTYTVNTTTGAVAFDPLPTFFGAATPITYRVADDNGSTSTASIEVTVAPDDPQANADTASTSQGVPVTTSVLTNDTPGSLPLDPTTVRLQDPATGSFGTTVTIPGEGTYTVNTTTGAVTFAPEPSFTGAATPITYRVADTDGTTTTADYTVTVAAVTPTASNDSATLPSGTSVTIPVLGNDRPGHSAVPLDAATVRLQDPATGAYGTSVTIPGEGTYEVSSTGVVTFTPLDTFTGPATPVTYRVADANGVTDTATISVTVSDPPKAEDDTATTSQDTTTTVDVTANDNPGANGGAPLDPTTVRLRDPATGAYGTSVTIPGEGRYTVDSAGKVTFDPVPGFAGPATPITYRVADRDGLTTTATLTISVTPKPAARPDEVIAGSGAMVILNPLGNDRPSSGAKFLLNTMRLVDPGTGRLVTSIFIPGQGRWTVLADGRVAFTAVDGFSGQATIDYVVQDSSGRRTGSTLSVAVSDDGAPVTSDELSGLPSTGSQPGPFVGAGLGLLAIGAALTAAARRRRYGGEA
ncbi:MAG: Ig-like domain-containing protein [Angustibacter sp.]